MLSSPLFAVRLRSKFTPEQIDSFVDKLKRVIQGEQVFFDFFDERIMQEFARSIK